MNEKQWAMASHLGALILYVGVPFGNIIVPLVIWLSKKNESAFIESQAKESLNFQITFTILAVIFGILSIGLIGLPFLVAIAVAHVVLTIVATVEVDKGRAYRYPINFRFVQ